MNTDEPSNFDIYYTTDGTIPTITPSNKYDSTNKPTMSGSNLTIKAIAIANDNNYFDSPVYTFNYTDND
ncbi:MAG: FN3 associated domain-containing protein [Halanaerobiales bacterium]|nr:FN3 associated domain-containing protein [Halanaerobiales bacterium]